MKVYKLILTLFFVLLVNDIYGQTQQGYVKTLGRPDKKGVGLGDVSIRIKGEHNAVLSDKNGTFSVKLPNKKNGDAYSLHQVQKAGYELNEKGVIGRQYAFSDKVPLTIVMVSTKQLQADRQRIENNAYKVAEKNYHAKLAQLENDREAGTITVETYRQELQDLQDKFEKYQSLIDGLAEHYAHVDYDELDEKDREINICIENGELERADSLIHTLFDPIGVLKRNKEALSKIDKDIQRANEMMEQAHTDMAAVLKQQEKDAEYLYQLYTIALAKFDNEKAAKYIETRAELDTTYSNWQFDAASYCHEQRQIQKAEFYYNRALGIHVWYMNSILSDQLVENDTIAHYANGLGIIFLRLADLYYETDRLREGEAVYKVVQNMYRQLIKEYPIYELNLANTLNGQANLYRKYNFFTGNETLFQETEALFQEALTIYRRLAQTELQSYEPYIALVLDNLGLLYLDIHRYDEAETLFKEALEIRRRLARDNPQERETEVAQTMNNLGLLYSATYRYAECEELLKEALEIRRRLSFTNPQAYEFYIAQTLNGLGLLYMENQRISESEAMFRETLEIQRRLAKVNPQAYDFYVAQTLVNLGQLYFNDQRFAESEALFESALEIRKRLAQVNPKIYDIDVVLTLNNLGVLYIESHQTPKGEHIFLEALDICKKLAKEDSKTYDVYVAAAMTELAILYSKTQRLTESEKMYKDALEIRYYLARDNPKTYEPDIVQTIDSLANLYFKTQRFVECEAMCQDALDLYRGLASEDLESYGIKVINTLENLALLHLTTNNYKKGFDTYEELLPLLKAEYSNDSLEWKESYASALGNQSFYSNFMKYFSLAEQYAREGIKIDPTQQFIYSNLAVALLFQGKYVEAEAIYRQYKNELKDSFFDDFKLFAEANVIPEEYKSDVERIKQILEK